MPPALTKKRYNLRDVAQLAGVSVATVSRVLNAPARVAPTTRSRVTQAMEELRFVPSAAARAINTGRTHMVAALLPTLDSSIYARVVDGLENKLSVYGLSLMVAQTLGDPAVEFARTKRLIEMGAEGLIVVGLSHSPEFKRFIEHVGVPVLAVSNYQPESAIPTIGYDNWEAAELAAMHLIGLGHQKIAVVHAALRNNDRAQRRVEALLSLAGQAEFSFFEANLTFSGGCKAAGKVLKAKSKATAVLCFSDAIAMGVIAEIQRSGLSVPGDISVIGMEDLPSSGVFHPTLTSVNLQVDRMGELAAVALAKWVESSIRPEPVCLPVKLIKRQSTARN